MFKRNSIPQRSFSLTTSEIKEDIVAVCACEEQRNMLYYCLDEKPPQEYKFAKMEEFLTGSNNLESVAETLQKLVQDVNTISKDIKERAEDLKIKTEQIRTSQT